MGDDDDFDYGKMGGMQDDILLGQAYTNPDKLQPAYLMRAPAAADSDEVVDDTALGSELLAWALRKIPGAPIKKIELAKRLERILEKSKAKAGEYLRTFTYFDHAVLCKDFPELLGEAKCQAGPDPDSWDQAAALGAMGVVRESLAAPLKPLVEQLRGGAPAYAPYKNLLWYSKQTVKREDFVDFRDLGVGAFGLVKATKHVELGKMLAIKVINRDQVRARGMFKEVIEEGNVLRMLALNPNPFCMYLLYAFSDETSFYYVMPVAVAGDLSFHIKHGTNGAKGLTLARSKFYFCELAMALAHLHSLDVVYRDMKPANVLLNHHGHCLLSDFGLAYVLPKKKKMRGRAGTQGFWAPEIIDSGSAAGDKRTSYDHRSDWWSLGATLYNFLAATDPFSKTNMSSLGEKEIKTRNEGTRKWAIKYPAKTPSGEAWPEEVTKVLGGLMERNVKKRVCGVAKLSKLAWLKDVDFLGMAALKVDPPFVPVAGELYVDQALDLTPPEADTAREDKPTAEEQAALDNVENKIEFVNNVAHECTIVEAADMTAAMGGKDEDGKKLKPYGGGQGGAGGGEARKGSSACAVS